ncbi:MAG: metallophosphoesterase [Myxococcales bacterium]|nr:metallophosphoesterase [Myxococcales bacterium]
MRSRLLLSVLVVGFAGALGCGSPDDPGGGAPVPYTPTPLSPLSLAPLGDELTLVPSHAVSVPAESRKPYEPVALAALLAEGYGDFDLGPGEGHVTVAPPGATPPAPGPNARLLVRFAHLADFQLADDESPARLALFDAPEITNAAFRPQEGHGCRIVNAMVRTVNKVHDTAPLDFVLLGGDNADNAEGVELDWVMAILGGDPRVECDTGADDDPLAGQDNDPKDPFVADGLAVPWYWVTGNHDVLKQGNIPVSDLLSAEATGDSSAGGTRDWSRAGGPLFKGPVVPDAARALLERPALMARIAADGDGHGIGAAQVASGKAYYTFDVPGTPLRFVVLDTGAESGGSDGLVRQGDVDALLVPALDAAQAEGKWVVLASHHSVGSLSNGVGLGGSEQPDAVLSDAYADVVGAYPNVLYSMVGHSHEHRVRQIAPAAGHAWWEVMTSAVADYPHQARIVEIWDQDDGWVMLRATTLDYATEGDPVAAEGRRLGLVDFTAGWCDDGRAQAADRNVELWIAAPP